MHEYLVVDGVRIVTIIYTMIFNKALNCFGKKRIPEHVQDT